MKLFNFQFVFYNHNSAEKIEAIISYFELIHNKIPFP